MEYTATQGWFSFEGQRARMSFFLAGLLQLIVASVVSMFFFASIFASIFAAVISGSPASAGGLSALAVMSCIAFCLGFVLMSLALVIQRIRSIGFYSNTEILLGIVLYIVVPLSAFILLFWPQKETQAETIINNKPIKSNIDIGMIIVCSIGFIIGAGLSEGLFRIFQ